MARFDLSVAGNKMRVRHLNAHLALSELFRFEIETASEEPPAVADLVGATFELTVEEGFEHRLVVRGVVMRAEGMAAGGHGTFFLELAPEVAPLATGRDQRVFQEMSAVDIIKKVLQTAGVPDAHVRWSTTGSYATRHYCAQYRESDWHFIARLAAEEGIYFWFDFGDDATVLVFADDSTAAPDLDGGAELPFHDDDGMLAPRDAVHCLGREAVVVTDAVRLRDYNPDKPKVELESTAGSGARTLYDYPGRFGVPAQGDKLAKTWCESLHARSVVTTGETTSARVRPGLVLEITGHPVEAVNGRLLVVELDIAVQDRDSDVTRWAFTAIPAKTPFRAPRGRVTVGARGPQTGVVVGASGEEIHPDSSGRIRVQLHWDREGKLDDKASTWMRVGQFPLGGSMILPRVGWDVLVDHYEGDVDAPFVMTHLYDGQHRVPYALPANKTRTAWQTATTPGGGSTNELRFEDGAGKEEVFINASKDMNVVVGDKKGEKIGNNHTHSIGSNHDVTVGSNLVHGVGAQQTVSIGGSETVSVSAGRSVAVKGSESSTVGGSRSVTVSSGHSLEAKGGRTLTVGGTMMGAAAMGINRTATGTMSVTVGGSAIAAAATGLEASTGGAAAETIGGAKIQLGASGCEMGVKGASAETVGGAYVIAAGGNAGESATGTLAITVGGAFLANAPSVEIEADTEISIRVGGASLTITPSSIEVKAPTLASPGAVIDKKAGSIHHN